MMEYRFDWLKDFTPERGRRKAHIYDCSCVIGAMKYIPLEDSWG